METIRIFISSPGDVAEERERARQVVQGLRRRYARHFDVVPVVWEEMPLGLDASFQQGIDMLLSKEQGVDIAVFILWSRLGSALGARHTRHDGREYRSGTERELDMMLEARAAQGGRRPHILAYTRDDEVSFEESLRGRSTAEKEESIRQKRLVEGFIREQFHDTSTGVNLRAYHTYQRPQTFGERLRVHLQEILDGLSAGRFGRPAWDIDHRGPPFLGLESFSFAHAEVFFGREDEVLEGRLRLAAAARRGAAFLLVSGGSGTGKSSLAAAGILPEIVAHETDDQVARWLHAVFTPAALAGDPATGTAKILMEAVPSLADRVDVGDLAAALRDGPAAAVRLAILPALKSAATGSGAVRLVLLVDQLEELFTDPRLDDGARDLFVEILGALATSGHVWVVATIRGDFHERLLGCEGLRRLKSDGGHLDLGPPTVDALRRMIESPATLAGLSFEKTGDTTLADRILRDVSGQAELLPLLEDLLRAMFDERTADGVLTVAAYESLGGIAGALSRRAEASLSALPPEIQRAFPDVLRRLVAIGEGGEATGVRRRVPLDSFPAGSAARAVVERLVADRLATASAGSDGTAEVAIAHEAILRLWPRAAAWIVQNTEFLRLRDRLAARMQEGAPLSAADPLVPAARAALEGRADTFEPDLAAYVEDQLRAIDDDGRRRVRWRWIGVGATLATLVAVAVGGFAMYDRADRQKRQARAEAAVEGLVRAGGGQIAAAAAAATDPAIVGQSAALLREAFDQADTPAEKVRAAIGLARLPGTPDDVADFLVHSLLGAEPGEIESIRTALTPWRARFEDLLWAQATGRSSRGERLRAAAALAAYDPADDRWKEIAPAVAADLVGVPAVHLASWLEAFRNVRGILVPALVPIFADPERREMERSLAADILADYAGDEPDVLADLTMAAEPAQFTAIVAPVEANLSRIVPILEAELSKTIPADLPSSAPERETLGIRQAKAAAVLARCGRHDRVWPLFVHSPDPRVRSYLIHFLRPFGADPRPLADRLVVEKDVSARRGLVLAIGEMAGADVPDSGALADFRASLLPSLRSLYETDPDPGVHEAAEWTLRQFNDMEWVTKRVDAWREVAAGNDAAVIGDLRKALANDGGKASRWLVNGQGQTLVVVRGPVDFLMGSPATEVGHRSVEMQHHRRIPRSFVIAAKPVRLADYSRLVGDDDYAASLSTALGAAFVRSPDLPVMNVSWDDAAKYCNMLSDVEGIPRSEWIYDVDSFGNVRIVAEWLARSGYRLPTEAEWEYAVRANATTSRFFGESPALLPSYAWFQANSGYGPGLNASWPVGMKKPNDVGLSDALGNGWNWCHDRYVEYAAISREGSVDDVFAASDGVAIGRVLRGGSCDASAAIIRSANRNAVQPRARYSYYGLRVCRTVSSVGDEDESAAGSVAGGVGSGPEIRNSVDMSLRRIEAGAFIMGGADGRPAAATRRISLSKPFFIGVSEVTNGQWREVMGEPPSRWKDDRRPVEQVSWAMAVRYCEALSGLPAEKAAGRVYRLPTEAEWEYACRAGTTTKYPFGDDSSWLEAHAWFAGNSGDRPLDAEALLSSVSRDYAEYERRLIANGCQTHSVGLKKPNAWGLHDMLGNVSEWCQDRFGEPEPGAAVDPSGPPTGDLQVDKGSSWWHNQSVVNPAWRYGRSPNSAHMSVGFRVVMTETTP